ncbi:MAG: LLM class flavin-dependent oxidoreductase [Propionibacteriales bacterium]|nr:LLM class flavin-dependent oxidoreductase [Propionibacteriales bacterium]
MHSRRDFGWTDLLGSQHKERVQPWLVVFVVRALEYVERQAMRLHVRVAPPPLGADDAVFGESVAKVVGHDAVAGVFISDSPRLWNDTLLTLAKWVPRYPEIPFTIAATNFVMRHWAVVRNSADILADASNAEFRVGVARGDSAVRDVGLKPQPISEFINSFEQFVGAAGEDHRATPTLIATNGPKLMRYAGGHADGVIVQIGVEEGIVKEAVDHIRAGAEEAGRDPSEVSIILSTLFIDPDYDEAVVEQIMARKYGAISQRDPQILQKMGIPVLPPLEGYVDLAHTDEDHDLPADPGAVREFRERYFIPGAPADAAALFRRLEQIGITEAYLMDLGHNAPPDAAIGFIEDMVTAG